MITGIAPGAAYNPNITLLRGVWITEHIAHYSTLWGELTGLHYTLVDDEDQPVLDERGKLYIFDTIAEAERAVRAILSPHLDTMAQEWLAVCDTIVESEMFA